MVRRAAIVGLACLAGAHAGEDASGLFNTHDLKKGNAKKPDPEDTVQGREDASAKKWGYLANAQEFWDAHMKVWTTRLGGKKKGKGPLGIPGIDTPSIYPEAIWKPGHSTMLSATTFHSDITDAVTAGKTLIVRFVNSDIPDNTRQGAKDQGPAWNAVVRAFANHPKVTFGDVSKDDTWTGGQWITHTPDWEEMKVGHKGWPYLHWWNRDTDVGGEAYEAAAGAEIAQELKSPYDMMALLEDSAGAYICTLATGAGCSQAELEYAKIMKEKNAFELKRQMVGLRSQAKSEDAEDDADLRTSIHQRISVLKQLAAGIEAGDSLPPRHYVESWDPGYWDVDVTPAYIQEAKKKMATVQWTEDLILPWLPKGLTKGMRGRKKLADFVWDIAEKDTEYIATNFLGVIKKKEDWQIQMENDRAEREAAFKKSQDDLPPQLRGYAAKEYDPAIHDTF